jgi:hypothetical protein
MDRLPPLLRAVEDDVEVELIAVEAGRVDPAAGAADPATLDAGELERYEGQLRSLQGAVLRVVDVPAVWPDRPPRTPASELSETEGSL